MTDHPEGRCHRCDGPNISWYTPGGVWDPVMRADGEWKWQEIICPLCFVEMAGGGTWALLPMKADGQPWTSADERAAIVSRAKAEALREAADSAADYGDFLCHSGASMARWLRDRADREAKP